MTPTHARPWRRLAAAAALLAASGGCGSDGPKRYRVSGTVTHAGKPVARGFVTFSPDTAKGNSGPGGGAAIIAGRYRTEAENGVGGGPHLVGIVGTDGVPFTRNGEVLKDGRTLFPPYQTAVDFPARDSEQDFDVPAR